MNPKPDSHAPVADNNEERSLQTRWSLIGRLKDLGDERSWQEFFDIYWRLIRAVAIKAGLTDTEAQEVVQETVIAVAKKMPEFKCDPAAGSFKGFLLQITGWRITDQFRKRKVGQASRLFRSGETPAPRSRHADADESQTATVERVPDPRGFELERVWDEEWETHLTEAALQGVKRKADPEQFQMFDLHVLKQLPVREVARKLGVNGAQVYFAKYKISALLKKELKSLQKDVVFTNRLSP